MWCSSEVNFRATIDLVLVLFCVQTILLQLLKREFERNQKLNQIKTQNAIFELSDRFGANCLKFNIKKTNKLLNFKPARIGNQQS